MNTTPKERIPIADKTLWDSLGNYCRVTMHTIGSGTADRFEVYFHDFNTDIPTRFVGTIGECNHKADHWIASKKAEGFAEQRNPARHPMNNRTQNLIVGAVAGVIVLLIGFALGQAVAITESERDWARMQRDAAIKQAEIKLFQR